MPTAVPMAEFSKTILEAVLLSDIGPMFVLNSIAVGVTKTDVPSAPATSMLTAREVNDTALPSAVSPVKRALSLGCMPPSVWLTNDISPVERSFIKTSYWSLLSPAPLTNPARLDAVLSNAIFVPSKLNIALFEYPFPISPSFDVLAMDISPVDKSFTKSWGPELPPATRFVEPLVKATRLPSGETLSDVPNCPA